MFRFFESLVDPFVDYREVDTPPTSLRAFLWDYSQPFKRLFAYAAGMSFVSAAVEVWLIWYMGRLVDLLTGSAPSEVWAAYGTEFILVALFVLLIRPLIQAVDVLLLNNGLLPNFGTLIRWRVPTQSTSQR